MTLPAQPLSRFTRLVALVLAANLVLGAVAYAADPPYTQQEDVVFGETDGVALVMDIFTPTGPSNGLGIIDVASGAWHSDRGKIEDHKRAQMFDILCGRGYTVFAVRPGSISKFAAPEMVRHIKWAVRWVKLHSADYGIDPDRLAMAGASAGGHLTCLTIMTAEPARPDARKELDRYSTEVKAAIAFFPPTDFMNYGGQKRDISEAKSRLGRMLGNLLFAEGIEGKSDEQIAEQIEKISPALLVHSAGPPLLLIHGDNDPLVPLQQSETMKAACEKAGVLCELIVKPGGGHPWPTIHEEVKVAADWLDKQLAAPPAIEAETAEAPAAN